MRLLLDTHAFLWWVFQNPRLKPEAVTAIGSADEVYVSAVTAYEIMFKYSRGRLPEAGVVARDVVAAVDGEGFRPLPIALAHAETAGHLPLYHRDPWNRLLAAQALKENLTLVSADATLDAYGISRLW